MMRSAGGADVEALLREISALTKQVHVLAREARTDPLTGLANRRGWDEQLRRELARARRSKGVLSVGLLDLDDFKSFNDRHGHQAGDQLLAEAATAWRVHLREADILCRWGGDEFALLLPDCPWREAQDVLTRLDRATPSPLSCATGLATWDGGEPSDELLRRADTALLEEKDNRRGLHPLTGEQAPSGAGLRR